MVRAHDPHYGAKALPHAHPYGTATQLSDQRGGIITRLVQSKTGAIQTWFNKSTQWTCFMIVLRPERTLNTDHDMASKKYIALRSPSVPPCYPTTEQIQHGGNANPKRQTGDGWRVRLDVRQRALPDNNI